MGMNTADETVGENFKEDLLQEARDKTLKVIEKSFEKVCVGMTEEDVKALVRQVQDEELAEREWHAPQVRFAENTILPFGMKGKQNPTLQENDILFLDLGLVFDGHEGDVGRPLVMGEDSEKNRCCKDVQDIWFEVREHWQQTSITGKELYDFASQRAEQRGWQLNRKKANGHRISDFPHAVNKRGTIEFFDDKISTNRWILEIQIVHRENHFGAFYEDLLN